MPPAIFSQVPLGTSTQASLSLSIFAVPAQELFEVEHVVEGRRLSWLLPILPGFVLDVNADRVLADVPPGMLPEELE